MTYIDNLSKFISIKDNIHSIYNDENFKTNYGDEIENMNFLITNITDILENDIFIKLPIINLYLDRINKNIDDININISEKDKIPITFIGYKINLVKFNNFLIYLISILDKNDSISEIISILNEIIGEKNTINPTIIDSFTNKLIEKGDLNLTEIDDILKKYKTSIDHDNTNITDFYSKLNNTLIISNDKINKNIDYISTELNTNNIDNSNIELIKKINETRINKLQIIDESLNNFPKYTDSLSSNYDNTNITDFYSKLNNTLIISNDKINNNIDYISTELKKNNIDNSNIELIKKINETRINKLQIIDESLNNFPKYTDSLSSNYDILIKQIQIDINKSLLNFHQKLEVINLHLKEKTEKNFDLLIKSINDNSDNGFQKVNDSFDNFNKNINLISEPTNKNIFINFIEYIKQSAVNSFISINSKLDSLEISSKKSLESNSKDEYTQFYTKLNKLNQDNISKNFEGINKLIDDFNLSNDNYKQNNNILYTYINNFNKSIKGNVNNGSINNKSLDKIISDLQTDLDNHSTDISNINLGNMVSLLNDLKNNNLILVNKNITEYINIIENMIENNLKNNNSGILNSFVEKNGKIINIKNEIFEKKIDSIDQKYLDHLDKNTKLYDNLVFKLSKILNNKKSGGTIYEAIDAPIIEKTPDLEIHTQLAGKDIIDYFDTSKIHNKEHKQLFNLFNSIISIEYYKLENIIININKINNILVEYEKTVKEYSVDNNNTEQLTKITEIKNKIKILLGKYTDKKKKIDDFKESLSTELDNIKKSKKYIKYEVEQKLNLENIMPRQIVIILIRLYKPYNKFVSRYTQLTNNELNDDDRKTIRENIQLNDGENIQLTGDDIKINDGVLTPKIIDKYTSDKEANCLFVNCVKNVDMKKFNSKWTSIINIIKKYKNNQTGESGDLLISENIQKDDEILNRYGLSVLKLKNMIKDNDSIIKLLILYFNQDIPIDNTHEKYNLYDIKNTDSINNYLKFYINTLSYSYNIYKTDLILKILTLFNNKNIILKFFNENIIQQKFFTSNTKKKERENKLTNKLTKITNPNYFFNLFFINYTEYSDILTKYNKYINNESLSQADKDKMILNIANIDKKVVNDTIIYYKLTHGETSGQRDGQTQYVFIYYFFNLIYKIINKSRFFSIHLAENYINNSNNLIKSQILFELYHKCKTILYIYSQLYNKDSYSILNKIYNDYIESNNKVFSFIRIRKNKDDIIKNSNIRYKYAIDSENKFLYLKYYNTDKEIAFPQEKPKNETEYNKSYNDRLNDVKTSEVTIRVPLALLYYIQESYYSIEGNQKNIKEIKENYLNNDFYYCYKLLKNEEDKEDRYIYIRFDNINILNIKNIIGYDEYTDTDKAKVTFLKKNKKVYVFNPDINKNYNDYIKSIKLTEYPNIFINLTFLYNDTIFNNILYIYNFATYNKFIDNNDQYINAIKIQIIDKEEIKKDPIKLKIYNLIYNSQYDSIINIKDKYPKLNDTYPKLNDTYPGMVFKKVINKPICTPSEYYYFGKFTNIFDSNINNKNISNHTNSNFNKLVFPYDSKSTLPPYELNPDLHPKDICVIGFGQSGSGKTSVLVQFGTEDGIIINFCQSPEFLKNIQKVTLTSYNLYLHFTESLNKLVSEKDYKNFDKNQYRWIPKKNYLKTKLIDHSTVIIKLNEINKVIINQIDKINRDIVDKIDNIKSLIDLNSSKNNDIENSIEFIEFLLKFEFSETEESNTILFENNKIINDTNNQINININYIIVEKRPYYLKTVKIYTNYYEKVNNIITVLSKLTINSFSDDQKQLINELIDSCKSYKKYLKQLHNILIKNIKYIDELDKTKDNYTNLSQFILDCFEDRTIEPTSNNDISSRSHVLVNLKLTHNNNKESNIIVCDLAGIENIFNCEGEGYMNEIYNFNKKYFENIKNENGKYSTKFIDIDKYVCKDISINNHGNYPLINVYNNNMSIISKLEKEIINGESTINHNLTYDFLKKQLDEFESNLSTCTEFNSQLGEHLIQSNYNTLDNIKEKLKTNLGDLNNVSGTYIRLYNDYMPYLNITLDLLKTIIFYLNDKTEYPDKSIYNKEINDIKQTYDKCTLFDEQGNLIPVDNIIMTYLTIQEIPTTLEQLEKYKSIALKLLSSNITDAFLEELVKNDPYNITAGEFNSTLNTKNIELEKNITDNKEYITKFEYNRNTWLNNAKIDVLNNAWPKDNANVQSFKNYISKEMTTDNNIDAYINDMGDTEFNDLRQFMYKFTYNNILTNNNININVTVNNRILSIIIHQSKFRSPNVKSGTSISSTEFNSGIPKNKLVNSVSFLKDKPLTPIYTKSNVIDILKNLKITEQITELKNELNKTLIDKTTEITTKQAEILANKKNLIDIHDIAYHRLKLIDFDNFIWATITSTFLKLHNKVTELHISNITPYYESVKINVTDTSLYITSKLKNNQPNVITIYNVDHHLQDCKNQLISKENLLTIYNKLNNNLTVIKSYSDQKYNIKTYFEINNVNIKNKLKKILNIEIDDINLKQLNKILNYFNTDITNFNINTDYQHVKKFLTNLTSPDIISLDEIKNILITNKNDKEDNTHTPLFNKEYSSILDEIYIENTKGPIILNDYKDSEYKSVCLLKTLTSYLEGEGIEKVLKKNVYTIINDYIMYIKIQYNCTIRRYEGFMINKSLSELRQDIKTLSLQNIGDGTTKPIYFDKDIFPYCRNINYYDEDIFEKFNESFNESGTKSSLEYGVIINQINIIINNNFTSLIESKEKLNNLNFFILTVLNVTDLTTVNNPPKPPYININELIYFTTICSKIYNLINILDESKSEYITEQFPYYKLNKNKSKKDILKSQKSKEDIPKKDKEDKNYRSLLIDLLINTYINMNKYTYYSGKNSSKKLECISDFKKILEAYEPSKDIMNIIIDNNQMSKIDNNLLNNANNLIKLIKNTNAATLIGSIESTEFIQNITYDKVPCSFNNNLYNNLFKTFNSAFSRMNLREFKLNITPNKLMLLTVPDTNLVNYVYNHDETIFTQQPKRYLKNDILDFNKTNFEFGQEIVSSKDKKKKIKK
jgi:hypothetical protein